jgi:hypothetical protein
MGWKSETTWKSGTVFPLSRTKVRMGIIQVGRGFVQRARAKGGREAGWWVWASQPLAPFTVIEMI